MPNDWARRAYEQLKTDKPRPLRGSDFYGSSDDFREWLAEHRERLCVDEGSIVPLTDQIDWTPDRESPSGSVARCCNERFQESHRRRAALVVHRIAGHVWLYQIGGSAPEFLPLETEPFEGCPHCRGRIPRGSHLYCPRCYRSGFDRRLWAQVKIVGYPPPHVEQLEQIEAPAAKPQPAPAPASEPAKQEQQTTRRARRARMFSGVG